tara:strand:+ start:18 stop:497 length:480 start_codon:yes stop_codon:yes gene_type:complete
MNNTWKEEYPNFTPHFTPADIFKLGSFGGAYFDASVENNWRKFVPAKFVSEFSSEEIDERLTRESFNLGISKYGVNCGSSYEDWMKSGWIKPQDPFGWVNWYINFYYGRRSDDDSRQVSRWKAFIPRHTGILRAHPQSLKTKQNMLHWAVDYKKIKQSS